MGDMVRLNPTVKIQKNKKGILDKISKLTPIKT